jgi:hypothetical protein
MSGMDSVTGADSGRISPWIFGGGACVGAGAGAGVVELDDGAGVTAEGVAGGLPADWTAGVVPGEPGAVADPHPATPKVRDVRSTAAAADAKRRPRRLLVFTMGNRPPLLYSVCLDGERLFAVQGQDCTGCQHQSAAAS